MGYDFNRPYIDQDKMDYYTCVDQEEASKYGKIVKATSLSNAEYKTRYNSLNHKIKMKNPPSCGRIFSGYIVVRKLGLKDQYETWMPDHIFEDFYKKDNEDIIDPTLHPKNSSYREKIIEHLFIGELLKESWKTNKFNIEISKPEVDNSGYDLIIENDNYIRHIQLKASYLGAKTSYQKVHKLLQKKPSGCVVWIYFNNTTLELGPFLFFGNKVGNPLPNLDDFKTAKHTKSNAKGEKNERPDIKQINKNDFRHYKNITELYAALFLTDIEDNNIS